MRLVELSFSDEQTVQVVSKDDLGADLIACGGKQLKPDYWFFPVNGTKAIYTVMKRLAQRGIFTYLDK